MKKWLSRRKLSTKNREVKGKLRGNCGGNRETKWKLMVKIGENSRGEGL